MKLPLLKPEAAAFRVGPGPPRGYVRGQALVSDDSFEHMVEHHGGAPRAVLLLAVEHPGLHGNCS